MVVIGFVIFYGFFLNVVKLFFCMLVEDRVVVVVVCFFLSVCKGEVK